MDPFFLGRSVTSLSLVSSRATPQPSLLCIPIAFALNCQDRDIFRVVVGVHGVVGWRLVRGFPRAARAPALVRFLPQLWVQRDHKNAASENTSSAGARTQRRRCSQSRSHFLGAWACRGCASRHVALSFTTGATASESPLACGMYVPHVPSVLMLVCIATYQRCSRGRVVWECRRPVPLTSTVTKLARS